MLENVLFFINILNIAMSARCSVIIHQTSAFVILLEEVLLYYLAIFVGGGRGGSTAVLFLYRYRYLRYNFKIGK